MTTTTFDTLGYFERLKAAGVPEAQAKVQTDALRDLADSRLVTKEHLDIRLAELKNDLLRWMLGIAAGQIALIVALIAFVK
ncbi:hypothetical protein [uncultured Desulfovibrio sp.]|uniref:hypothetical protein n=1 Tax=uncultured Desulfovibrio sp. TaxID=167968 RepID=UPI002803A7F3|nr:hypothetical protein [uncultured Desulfovibrio sp.]